MYGSPLGQGWRHGLVQRERMGRVVSSVRMRIWSFLDGKGAYLEGTGGAFVERPVVVEVEAYETQDGEVEEDFPSRY
jgi:hypothetical protein